MMSDRELDIALRHVSMWGEKCDRLAYAIYGLLEGDDPEDAAALLHELGYTDEDGFWKGEEE